MHQAGCLILEIRAGSSVHRRPGDVASSSLCHGESRRVQDSLKSMS